MSSSDPHAPALSPRSRSAWLKRLASVLVSAALLAAIYSRLDLTAIGRALRETSPGWLAAAVAVLAAAKLLQAWRLAELMPRGSRIGLGESTRLTLAGDVLNLILPSKMGDVAKAWFLRRRGHLPGSLALSLVLVEKAHDVLALLAWCALGLALHPPRTAALRALALLVAAALAGGGLVLYSRGFARLAFRFAAALCPARFRPRVEGLRQAWEETHAYFRAAPAQYARVAAASLALWLLHFVQLWLTILALGAWAPFPAHLALASLAILAGLVPLTFAGLGPRDAALIALYRPYFDAGTAAALGLLFTARYLLPALAGLPFFRGALVAARREEIAERGN